VSDATTCKGEILDAESSFQRGKSGLITLAPFAVGARKVLVIAPGLRIAEQLLADFDPATEIEMLGSLSGWSRSARLRDRWRCRV
jgi:hypothetical protein